MGKKMEIDHFLREYSKDNPELRDALEPDFDRIKKAAIQETSMFRFARKPAFRIAAAVLILFAAFVVGTFFSASPVVRAYRQKAESFVYSIVNRPVKGDPAELGTGISQIDEIQKRIPYTIPVPHWLPDGFSLAEINDANMGDGIYSVSLRYKNEKGNKLEITIINEIDADSASVNATSPEHIDVRGMDVVVDTNGDLIRTYFTTGGGLFVQVIGNLDKQAALNVALGIY